jgi:hypothetical protein
MINKGPAVPTALATVVVGLVLGGAGGYYGRASQETPHVAATSGGGMGGGMGGGGMGMMGGMGGRGGGGGGQQASPSRDLTGLVRNLATMEKVQNKGLSADQKKALLPVLKQIQSADKLTDKDCEAKLASIQGILSSDQKDALKSLQPQRGGRGGGGGVGRGGGGGGAGGPRATSAFTSAGPPGGGGGGGRGGGGGAEPDKPFANERNKQALDDLLGAVGGSSK